MNKKIAIVGSGISGLTAAYCLHQKNQVTVFEANNRVGGHTQTHYLNLSQQQFAVDSGFIVFNQKTYPNFLRLLSKLQVSYHPAEMGISVSDDLGHYYGLPNLRRIFANKLNLLKFNFLLMLKDIVRFNRVANNLLLTPDKLYLSINEFLLQYKFGTEFINRYFLPLASAIWSALPKDILSMPIGFLLKFYSHHGLLSLYQQPQWYSIAGGSMTYVNKILSQLTAEVKLSTHIQNVERMEQGVAITINKQRQYFDEVVFATPADTALQMITSPTVAEQEILGAFSYTDNLVTIHHDPSVMPSNKKAWASWNYYLQQDQVSLTYYMNRLQQLQTNLDIFVSLNLENKIDSTKVLETTEYRHPVFNVPALQAQQRHHEISGVDRLHFCGAYWLNGFHEDGVNSALRVCEYFGAGYFDE